MKETRDGEPKDSTPPAPPPSVPFPQSDPIDRAGGQPIRPQADQPVTTRRVDLDNKQSR